MPEPEPNDHFTALYQAHHRQVYAYAVTRAGRQLAEEIVAETFLVAWRRLPALPRATPLPWLLAVARNVVSERYRAEERQLAVVAEMRAWITDEELSVADVADGVAERAAVLTALAQLSEGDRELLTLIAWHGLTPRHAARVLGCSTASYYVRLHRARRHLSNAMAKATDPSTSLPAITPLAPKESIR
ncbi:sigma-70 family RNA polymerase sigma factor [Micromonospora andamanensis]|uniref:RNA polymerase sigma factor n=1 Tax=Micromonospora andamanensis TaxID=1287068 RepID=UPI0019505352|nr:RNA polymerase sigma factor [Micromonospora andamanensis]GIJ41144.1 DNA-directed RNA polymerase sigma-70 factor [Micromonospora andamanensis]